jgi:hypothetical protein
MRKLFITIISLGALLLTGEAYAQGGNLLFILERSKNVNQVCYEARITTDGLLDPIEPIHVYWINWVKDPTGKTREELTLLEKNIVYGCKVNKTVDGKYCSIAIVSYPERAFKVSLQNGKAVAETIINGQASYLDKIFIRYRETKMFPKVQYIELFGRAVSSDEPQYEKILLK